MQTIQITAETKTNGIVVCSFTNIHPINTVEEGIRQGHYNDYYRHITDQTVPLRPAAGAKTLHLVCFNRIVGETEFVELLRAEGKRPCQDAPNYKLGLMAQVPEEQMPEVLRNKDIVAAEPDNSSSVFTDEVGSRCFLYVLRYVADRGLSLTDVGRRWHDGWAFLAEDLVP